MGEGERKIQSQSHRKTSRASEESHPGGTLTLTPARRPPALTPSPHTPAPERRGSMQRTASSPHPIPLVSTASGPLILPPLPQ